eukprot:TRINITY_DN21957_c0_g1_i3.p1 TRINITY_DN21957_c0_g1~~TRINITY_DN21957_c0_g1_i3.p1  ORF type:complete len:138 (+),score=17.80 TRINITY_DN21957_c0_g1_i3:240-653(+)
MQNSDDFETFVDLNCLPAARDAELLMRIEQRDTQKHLAREEHRKRNLVAQRKASLRRMARSNSSDRNEWVGAWAELMLCEPLASKVLRDGVEEWGCNEGTLRSACTWFAALLRETGGTARVRQHFECAPAECDVVHT